MNDTSIGVYCRVRPLGLNEERASLHYGTLEKEKREKVVLDATGEFEFHKVFDEKCSNTQIYDQSLRHMIDSWFKGYNGTLFAYGQTCSGKTHTIFGHEGNERGIIYQALDDIFAKISTSKKRKYLIALSYVEIYNETVNDLLSSDVESIAESLSIREQNGVFYIENVTEEIISDKKQAMQLLKIGNSRKVMGYSYLHDKSSRSHTLFRLTLASIPRRAANGKSSSNIAPFICELNFVDLAGSEALTHAYGEDQQKETKSVNLSLFCLKSVINALADKSVSFIPYRNSLLTKLLQNSLGGNSYTSIICTISPAQEHVPFTKRTLHFGQIASKISNRPKRNWLSGGEKQGEDYVKLKDESEVQTVEVKISEKQQKNEEKSLSNFLRQGDKMINEEKSKYVKTEAGDVYVAIYGDDNNGCQKKHVVVLHGFPSDHEEWSYLYSPLTNAGFCTLGIDMPGFGRSSGSRQSSRTEKHLEKHGTVDTVMSVLKSMDVLSPKNPIIMIGYDWGAGIALAFASKYPKLVSHIVAFHPSWTESLSVLNKVQCQTCLLWVPADQLHPFSFGKKMARAIKNSKFVKLDCGKFKADKAYNAWCCIGSQISKHIIQFIEDKKKESDVVKKKVHSQSKKNKKQEILMDEDDECEELVEDGDDGEEFDMLESMILSKSVRIAMNEMEKPLAEQNLKEKRYCYETKELPPENASKLEQECWAISRFRELLLSGEIKDYYNAYLFASSLKPLAIKLFGCLPTFHPTIDAHEFKKYEIYQSIPKCVELLPDFPRYVKGRQILVKTNMNADVKSGKKYLTYDPQSQDRYITYRAYINRMKDKQFIVDVDDVRGTTSPIIVGMKEVYHLNQPTNFSGEETCKLFEDGILCKYNDYLTKAKIMEAAFSISDLVHQLDFSSPNDMNTVSIQKKCVHRIRRVFDLIHFHNEPFESTKKRSTKPDVGRLAHYGQGNCHTLASVMAALLIPFSKLIGIEVRFRAGFFIKKGRDVDEEGKPIEGKWNGKPRNVDDHTWLELTFIPSLLTFVCDPSLNELCSPLDHCYSRSGLRYPSERLQCNSNNPLEPKVHYSPSISIQPVMDSICEETGTIKRKPLSRNDWKTILTSK